MKNIKKISKRLSTKWFFFGDSQERREKWIEENLEPWQIKSRVVKGEHYGIIYYTKCLQNRLTIKQHFKDNE